MAAALVVAVCLYVGLIFGTAVSSSRAEEQSFISKSLVFARSSASERFEILRARICYVHV